MPQSKRFPMFSVRAVHEIINDADEEKYSQSIPSDQFPLVLPRDWDVKIYLI